MLTDHHQHDRREAILSILASGLVRRQAEITLLLKKRGFAVTQSSVSRDLHELGALKASGRYLLPPAETSHANGKFGPLAQFVRSAQPAGPSLTVIRMMSSVRTSRWLISAIEIDISSAAAAAISTFVDASCDVCAAVSARCDV